MLDCWEEDPKSRPSFNQCKRRLGQILEEASPAKYIVVKEELSKQWSPLSREVSNQPNGGVYARVDATTTSTEDQSNESGEGSGPSGISRSQSGRSSCSNGPISYTSGETIYVDLAQDSNEVLSEILGSSRESSSSYTPSSS